MRAVNGGADSALGWIDVVIQMEDVVGVIAPLGFDEPVANLVRRLLAPLRRRRLRLGS